MNRKYFSVNRQNNFLWHFVNAASRSLVLRGYIGSPGTNVVVNEYPKSGGSWFSQLLAHVLEIPFPRNRLPMLETCLMQCHKIRPLNMKNVVIVWRDGRDVTVSYYYHLLTGNEYGDNRQVNSTLKMLGITDPNDIERYLPRFIEALMNCKIGPKFNWPTFVDRWVGIDGVLETRYELLLADAEGELNRIANSLGYSPSSALIAEAVENFSFKKQADRSAGSEVVGSFLRKGVSGDWKNKFTPEAEEVFNAYAGAALVLSLIHI